MVDDKEKVEQTTADDTADDTEITLTVSFLMKTNNVVVKIGDNVGEVITKFKNDRKIPESDNIRFVALGKFLDTKLSFGKNGIVKDMAIRAFKSGNPGSKNTSQQNSGQQPTNNQQNVHQQAPTNPNMNRGSFNMMDNPSMANFNMMNPNMMGMGGVPPEMANMSPSQVNLQLETLINDPNMLDMACRMMYPNANDQELEFFKKQFVDNVKYMKDNPTLMNAVTNQMRDMANNPHNPQMGMPQMNPNMFNQMSSPNQPTRNFNMPMNNFNPMMGYGMNQNQGYPSSLLEPCSHGFYHPFAYNMMSQLYQNRGYGGAHTNQPINRTVLSDQAIEEKYGAQLDQMYQMGYTNKKKNIEALRACGGNLELAINYILDNVGN